MKIRLGLPLGSVTRTVLFFAVFAELLLLSMPSAWAVPSYSRRYGVQCSSCHSMWGALNATGGAFKLSGYRDINGKPAKPETDDIEITKGVSIPSTLPLSFVTGVGIDSRTEKRQDTTGATLTSKGSSISLEDASIFMTSPLGEHLSAFVEFPMYETKAWEFTPTGKAEANNIGTGRHIQFQAENPAFEVAKFFWNNLLGDSAPHNSVNLLFGITHPPLAYSSGKVRLSVNQYLIYERRALDLISPSKVSDMIGSADEYLFRLGEPQGLAEVNGMLTFGAPAGDVTKKETFWAEYHLGLSNGSNGKADNNTSKDLYGRFVMRYFNQSLGLFVYRSPDTYDDALRSNTMIGAGGYGTANASGNLLGIMSGNQDANKATRNGIDFTLSLAPLGVPVWLENQLMYNRESNPTGFGQEFKWHGGFHQVNWQPSKDYITYARYDYIKGDDFDDTTSTVNGHTGVTKSAPREHDVIVGLQHLINANTKLVGEYRHHAFEDNATAIPAKLTDDGFTLRVMFGF